MCSSSYQFQRGLLAVLLMTVCSCGLLFSQDNYTITQYTSKQGLPQNSIRDLAFDTHGFLWLGTEGGIARFDGRSFRVFGPEDHPGLNNQRFTQLLVCRDSNIIFIDQLNAMYGLSSDTFSTLQHADITSVDKLRFSGGPPNLTFLAQDSMFRSEVANVRKAKLPDIRIFHAHDNKYYILSSSVLLVDIVSKQKEVIRSARKEKEKYACINGELLYFDSLQPLTRYQSYTNSFVSCSLTFENGKPCLLSFENATLFQQSLMKDLYVVAEKSLYKIWPGADHHYYIRRVIDQLPSNCKISAVENREKDNVLFLGTDSRGLFVYERKHFTTYIFDLPGQTITNSYYGQGLLDANTLLISNGLEINIETNTRKGKFPYFGISYLFCTDEKGFLYYTDSGQIYRYNPGALPTKIISQGESYNVSCLEYINNKVWVGTKNSIGYISGDSLIQTCHIPFRGTAYGVICMEMDSNQYLWFGSYFQLYRYHLKSAPLDSFPIIENGAYRALEKIDGKLFIGTYGNGYYIYQKGRFIRMPIGRSGEHQLPRVHWRFTQHESEKRCVNRRCARECACVNLLLDSRVVPRVLRRRIGGRCNDGSRGS